MEFLPENVDKYCFFDTDFLLSPDAAILRNLAESLYPSYLSRLNREGKPLNPHSIPALDTDFVVSSEGLWFRVLTETIYTEIILQRQKVLHTVLMFGSARIHSTHFETHFEKMADYYNLAADFAEKVTRWSIANTIGKHQPITICTGGGPGIMEAGNLGASRCGGKSIGLNILLPAEQSSNAHISDDLRFNFQYFFTRKFHFLRRAKAAIVFPGGFGSLDELFETLTLIQTDKIPPIPIILFGKQYWQSVINIDKLVEYGTISPQDHNLFEYHDDVDLAVESVTRQLAKYLKTK